MIATLGRCWEVTKTMLAFDFLSTHHPNRIDEQAYWVPEAMLRMSLGFSPSVRLTHNQPAGNGIVQIWR